MHNEDLNKQGLFNIKGERREFIAMKLQHILQLEDSYTLTQMKKNDFFQLIFITKGTGLHYIDFQSYEVKAGDIIFLNTWQHYRRNYDKSIRGYVLSFTPSFITQFVTDHLFIHDLPFFNRFTNHNVLELNDDLKVTIRTAIERILVAYETEDVEFINLIRTYLLEVLLLCKKEVEQTSFAHHNSTKNKELIKSFESLIDKHFYEYRFPKEYARVLLISPNYLNAICQKIKQKSAGDMIRDRILIECKRLLIHTDLSASEIAYQLNFKDNSYFSRFFKKHMGIGPDEYRRK